MDSKQMRILILLIKIQSMLILGAVCWLLPSLAFGHTGDGPHNGFTHGFVHPLSGLDHVLAMVAVGLWAAQRHDRMIWLIPLSFVAIMGLGGLLGMIVMPVNVAEHGIVLSLLILGLLLASMMQLPVSISIMLIGLFALSHGYAHGSEMPPGVALWSYAAGFMLATLGLHLCGIALGLLFKKLAHTNWLRLSGLMIACYGGFLWLQ